MDEGLIAENCVERCTEHDNNNPEIAYWGSYHTNYVKFEKAGLCFHSFYANYED